MKRIILIPLILCGVSLSACTLQVTSDVARFTRIEAALDTKADGATTAQNFQFIAKEVNTLKAAQGTTPAK